MINVNYIDFILFENKLVEIYYNPDENTNICCWKKYTETNEIIPKYIIINKDNIDDELKQIILTYLQKEYDIRNKQKEYDIRNKLNSLPIWVDVDDCNIDFNDFNDLIPIETSDTLHLYIEKYIVGDDEYKLIFNISNDNKHPLIKKLKK